MAVHTYVITSMTAPNVPDAPWSITGTADGLPFAIQLWASAINALPSVSSLQSLIKSVVDPIVFPVQPVKPPNLTALPGSFTL